MSGSEDDSFLLSYSFWCLTVFEIQGYRKTQKASFHKFWGNINPILIARGDSILRYNKHFKLILTEAKKFLKDFASDSSL